MADFILQSSLAASYREALEQLLFFNPRQAAARDAIARAVDAYGAPSIAATPDGLRVVVARRDDVQCLFALKTSGGGPKLAGMVVYLRTSPEEMNVLHLSVADWCCRGRYTAIEVAAVLTRAVSAVARRLRGVHRVSLFYVQPHARVAGPA
jgi:hypothetical protein